MQHWFRSGFGEWWVDRSPPPGLRAGEHEDQVGIDEVRCVDTHAAMQLVWRIFGDGYGLDAGFEFSRLLPDEALGIALPRLSRAERHRMLAGLIADGRMRIWRRRKRHERRVSGAGIGGEQGNAGVHVPPDREPMPRARAVPAEVTASAAATRLQPAEAADTAWYEFVLLDELGMGLREVAIEMTTPAGTQRLTSSRGGVVRIENVPPGTGFVRIDGDSLTEALRGRFGHPRRSSKPPQETALFKVITPSRAQRLFRFPHEQPLQVMVVSRTDVVVAGSDARWRERIASADCINRCRFTPGELDALHLCSRGNAESVQVDGEGPPPPAPPPDASAAAARAAATQATYTVRPGDSLWAIAGKVLGDPLRWLELRHANAALFEQRSPNLIFAGEVLQLPTEPAFGLIPSPSAWPDADSPSLPAFIDLDVDSLHEALFDREGTSAFDRVTGPLVRVPSAPEPVWDSAQPAADAAAVLASVVALEQGVPLDLLLQPPDLPEFDPAERAGPPRG